MSPIKKPKVKVNELREIDQLAFDTVMKIFYDFAIDIYEESPEAQQMGLEKTLETVVELVDKGLIKILVTDDNIPRLSVYDPEIGDYRMPDEDENLF